MFIYIGPDKSGSTWLYDIFKMHNNIFVPIAKDIYYFDKYYSKGKKWYEQFFKGSENYHCKGEISHDYMFSLEAMNRIKDDLPDVKLFTILRNPFEKIWSQYLFLIRSGITNKPFNIAIKEESELIEKCLYGKYLSQYINNFHHENFKVFYFEGLREEPKEFAKEIFQYLEVEYQDNLNYYEKSLAASKPNFFYLAKFAKKSAVVLRNLGLINILGMIKSNYIVKKILYKEYEKNEKPRMTKKEFDLVYNILYNDIKLLESVLEKDFSSWLIYKGENEKSISA